MAATLHHGGEYVKCNVAIIASRDPKGNKAPAGATQSTTVAKRFATRSRLRLSEASLHPLAQRLGNRDVGEAAARGHG
jgi:hypothetical protein